MAFVTALVAGILFGLGLLLSRMCDPQRVLAFLDVTGHWNPALAFTMGGAILVAAPAFLYARRHRVDLFGQIVALPDRFRFDRRLIGGSALFGLGWGLSGICPGPGLLLLTGGSVQSWVFVSGVVAGFYLLGLVPASSTDGASGDARSVGKPM
jgi:uncharacterized membrane protein YedE/YeeE